MTDLRKPVAGALAALLGIMVLLWFVRGPERNLSNLALFAVSLLLVPSAYFAVYLILYLIARGHHISDRALRQTCVVIFFIAVIALIGSALHALYDFSTHRSLPPPNLFAFGVALGAMRAWTGVVTARSEPPGGN